VKGSALLCCAMLAAVGIGVGIEATATPTIYGSPGPQFVIASPASLSVRDDGLGPARMTEFTGDRAPSGWTW